MRITIPQINYKTGDIRANREQIIQAIQKARQAKAELVIFPELAVCGALSEDWLEREDFIQECRMAIEQIASHCGHIAAIVEQYRANISAEDVTGDIAGKIIAMGKQGIFRTITRCCSCRAVHHSSLLQSR